MLKSNKVPQTPKAIDTNRPWKPLAIIGAFFNPVSTTDVSRAIDEARNVSGLVKVGIEKSDELHSEIDESTSGLSQS